VFDVEVFVAPGLEAFIVVRIMFITGRLLFLVEMYRVLQHHQLLRCGTDIE